jgi:hypothetical protein
MATSECGATDFADLLAQMPVINETTVVPDVERTPPFCNYVGELLFPVLMMLIGAGVYHIFLGPGASKKNQSVSGLNPSPNVSPALQNITPSVVQTPLPAAKAMTTTKNLAPPATSSTLPSTIPAAVVSHPSSAKATKPAGNGTKPPSAPKPALQNSTPATIPNPPNVAQTAASAAKATTNNNKQKVRGVCCCVVHMFKLNMTIRPSDSSQWDTSPLRNRRYTQAETQGLARRNKSWLF